MNEYNVFIDVSHDWEEDNIEVVQTTVKAINSKQANEKVLRDILEGKHDELIQDRLWYLWEVTEQDKIS